MKIIGWNVNGLRACLSKGEFISLLNREDPDIIAVQETKMQESQLEVPFDGYFRYMNSAERKGYSGTMILTKKEPLSVSYGIPGEHPEEGRVITLEYPDYYFVDCYVPNSKDGLLRLDYRMYFEDCMRAYLQDLDKKKPVIYTGDLNVAHEEIDLKNPDTNHFNAGFSDEERGKMTELLNAGFVDTFRALHPEEVKYSWWSYRMRARERGIGWRIDYFIVSQRLFPKVIDSKILDDVYGSDHCPVQLLLED
ncbi:MAG: exodeoxyribonuclease III [Erysipelotrichaceae bacterium]|nr:exodeoxyribonuclease III [Erysipelotrichaceae bacterium]MDO5439228.1 exodeoxyribonuclease III [Erysipelotrichaceae bacterium]